MKTVLEFLEESCKKNKNKIAVIEEDKQITYEELLIKSKIVGTNLIEKIKINDPVAVFMDKSIETLETFFGVVYAGGCYSLVNPEFPKGRIEQITEVLESNVIITNNEFLNLATEIFKNKIVLNVETLLKGEASFEKLSDIRDKKLDLDPVYINFTSGSTGVPKGVVVGNRSIIDFINEFTKAFNINENDIIANQAPFDFDVSVKDIYSAIKVGATLLIVPKRLFSNPAKLLDYLVDNKATTMVWAVSALCLITTFHGLDYKVPETVNKIIFSGEVMPIKHLNTWMSKLPNATFINVYGPTEITCNCTYHIIDREKEYNGIIPIGKPFLNEKVFLLDENNKEVTETGSRGEICVSGTCLALGYYNNKTQTDSHFCQNPLNTKYIEFIYRTGDLGTINDEGEFVFAGRKDFQIKYMGHRIELEEIDREVSKINNVVRAVTLFHEKKNKLYCFYIGNIEKEEIVEKLKESVPTYMVPSVFVKVEDFTLSKNGKIDRKILQKMIEE